MLSEKMIKAAADAYWGSGVEHAPMALEQMRETLVAARIRSALEEIK